MSLTKEEFVARFTARLVELVGPTYRDEDDIEVLSTAEYAEETAPTYFDEADQREERPEACAEADYSYWEPA